MKILQKQNYSEKQTTEEGLSPAPSFFPTPHAAGPEEIEDSEFHYLSAIGSLLYISGCTRPDIAAAVGILARHGATPGTEHVKAAKHLIQYVYRTRKLGIQYSKHRKQEEKDVPVIYGQGRHPADNGKII